MKSVIRVNLYLHHILFIVIHSLNRILRINTFKHLIIKDFIMNLLKIVCIWLLTSSMMLFLNDRCFKGSNIMIYKWLTDFWFFWFSHQFSHFPINMDRWAYYVFITFPNIKDILAWTVKLNKAWTGSLIGTNILFCIFLYFWHISMPYP